MAPLLLIFESRVYSNCVGHINYSFFKAFTALIKKDLKVFRLTLTLNQSLHTNNGICNLQCDEKLACELFMKYSFMMTIDMEIMKEHLKIMKGEYLVGKNNLMPTVILKIVDNQLN